MVYPIAKRLLYHAASKADEVKAFEKILGSPFSFVWESRSKEIMWDAEELSTGYRNLYGKLNGIKVIKVTFDYESGIIKYVLVSSPEYPKNSMELSIRGEAYSLKVKSLHTPEEIINLTTLQILDLIALNDSTVNALSDILPFQLVKDIKGGWYGRKNIKQEIGWKFSNVGGKVSKLYGYYEGTPIIYFDVKMGRFVPNNTVVNWGYIYIEVVGEEIEIYKDIRYEKR